MSGKVEHHADDAKSSVLKKAVSFRNDLKSRITRKSSSAFSNENAVAKSTMHRKKASLPRNGSFTEGHKESATVKKNASATKSDGVERLGVETKNVFRGLQYIQDVIDKGIIQQLHGSITVVLDQITEFKGIIQKCFPNQESSLLTSAFSGLHQTLAELMRLSDRVLLSNEDVFVNKQQATELILAVKISVQELVDMAKENVKNIDFHAPSSDVSPAVGIVDQDSQSSQKLDDHDDLNRLLYPKNAKSKSAENILDVCHYQRTSTDDPDESFASNTPTSDVPPPKPPMPQHFWAFADIGKFHSMPSRFSLRTSSEEIPPPLPEKKRNSAGLYESDAKSSQSSRSFTTNLTVPSNHSPTNSISSMFSVSSEDLLDEPPPPPKPSRLPSNSLHRQGSRSSQYDNISDSPLECSSNMSEFSKTCQMGMTCENTSSNRPPPLPAKKGPPSASSYIAVRHGSQYDNLVFEQLSLSPPAVTSHAYNANNISLTAYKNTTLSQPDVPCVLSKITEVHKKTYSVTRSQGSFVRSVQVNYSEVASAEGSQLPPPIPPKKHVQAYLSVFGGCSSSMVNESMRHSMYSATLNEASYCQNERNLGSLDQFSYGGPQSRIWSLGCSPSLDCDPGVTSGLTKSTSEDSWLNPPPLIPPKQRDQSSSQITLESGYCSSYASSNRQTLVIDDGSASVDDRSSVSLSEKPYPDAESVSLAAADASATSEVAGSPETPKHEMVNTLEDENVADQLISNEEGPEIRGGTVDALIVHATVTGSQDFRYQEAFLMTYRTFISPSDLIKKLLLRYNRFSKINDDKKKKLSRYTFSLLVRVVDELCRETDEQMLQVLMDLVYQLLGDGELLLARTMRKKVLEKFENYRLKQAASHTVTLLSSYQLTAKTHSITDFKAVSIAEQMTLLDAELFVKIEIPEVLRWSREQSEEHSLNLTEFTEHFNKMSYWCRTRILEQDDPKERERHLMKFIKIMKHLRRLNNFNSYLAILSAVDSAPVRRLEWQKQNVEALKEFCQLIDSSSSFRAYRQALAETEPPCIPYIGLVLQDLTFVNIGNHDFLPDGRINFSKCWQYYTILQNMSRFKKCHYDLKKNEKIIAFFNNFDNYLSEDSLWQISEMFKPRGGKTPAKQPD